jgi:maltose phosphorylase
MDMAYTFYLRTSRLDLDDYNKEVEEGISPLWLERGVLLKVLGNACKNDTLNFSPKFKTMERVFL